MRLYCVVKAQQPTKLVVFKRVTSNHDRLAKEPLLHKDQVGAGKPLLLVGKKEHTPNRRRRRTGVERLQRFRTAAEFAYEMDWPLNFALTITWTALLQTGEHNEGHCLTRDSWQREKYLRTELRRFAKSIGYPFVALWGRDIGAKQGEHVHLALFYPNRYLSQLVALLERVTGSAAEFALQPFEADCVARSVCGGWQLNMNNSSDAKNSSIRWIEYIASQHDKHPCAPELEGKLFGISQAIGKAAQDNSWLSKARPSVNAVLIAK